MKLLKKIANIFCPVSLSDDVCLFQLMTLHSLLIISCSGTLKKFLQSLKMFSISQRGVTHDWEINGKRSITALYGFIGIIFLFICYRISVQHLYIFVTDRQTDSGKIADTVDATTLCAYRLDHSSVEAVMFSPHDTNALRRQLLPG